MAVLIAGWIIDIASVNDAFIRREQMKGIMKHYSLINNFPASKEIRTMPNKIRRF